MRLPNALLALAAATGFAACDESGFKVVKAADGTKALQVKCSKEATDCLGEAHKACRSGYDVVDSDSRQASLLTDDLPGETLWYSMTFRCGTTGDAPRPEFPFRGEHRDATTATVPVGPAPGLANGTSASEDARRPPPRAHGCTMDGECGSGSVCAKAVASSEGQCARSVDSSGLPNGAGPRFGSGAAGTRQCSGPMDCGIGFRCDQGRCFKR